VSIPGYLVEFDENKGEKEYELVVNGVSRDVENLTRGAEEEENKRFGGAGGWLSSFWRGKNHIKMIDKKRFPCLWAGGGACSAMRS
jgi:hypothetical protein